MSNLPPGVTVSMIPGNRPEDMEAEAAADRLLDRLSEAGIFPEEYDIILDAGIAAVMAARNLQKLRDEDRKASDELAIEAEVDRRLHELFP